MASSPFERSPFPHEDAAQFERVLRNISTQEVMPRPMQTAPEYWYQNDDSMMYGDPWHYTPQTSRYYVVAGLRFLKNLAITTFIMGGVFWIAQPMLKPFIYVYRHFKGVVKYTLLIDPIVPERYDAFSFRSMFTSMRPLFPFTLKSRMMLAYKYIFLRMPVMIFGSWLASFGVWAIEDQYGEDSIVKTKVPIMLGGGLVAHFLWFSRGKTAAIARAPAAIFVGAASTIFLLDSLYIHKRGMQTLWNPLGIKLPEAATEILIGDPFNGRIVVGPIIYYTHRLLDALGFLAFQFSSDVSKIPSGIMDTVTEKIQSRNQDSGRASEYITSLDRKIEMLELEELKNQGYIDENPYTLQANSNYQNEVQKLFDGYETSGFNPMRFFSGAQDRLPKSSAIYVSDLFGNQVSNVLTAYNVPKPTNEIIFGNLLSGIEQSTSSEYVDHVRYELQKNASSSQPQPLGIAATDGFFAREMIASTEIANVLVDNPFAFIMEPLRRAASALYWWYPTRSKHAFDDYLHTVDHTPSSLSGRDLQTQQPHVSDSIFSQGQKQDKDNNILEDDLIGDPVPVTLPVIIPAPVAERQRDKYMTKIALEEERVLQSERTKEILGQGIASSISLVTDLAVGAASGVVGTVHQVSSSLAPQSPSTTTQSPENSESPFTHSSRFQRNLISGHSSSSSYMPADEYFRMIKASVDEETAAHLPTGISAQERLKNFVENVGGRDFEEPTGMIDRLKRPWYRANPVMHGELPVMGERMRRGFRDLKVELHSMVERYTNTTQTLERIARSKRDDKDAKLAQTQARMMARMETHANSIRSWFSSISSKLGRGNNDRSSSS